MFFDSNHNRKRSEYLTGDAIMNKRLNRVLALTSMVALPALAIAMGGKPQMSDSELEAINMRIAPVAQVRLAAADSAGAVAIGSRSGEAIYKAACAACHDAGVANAPKIGDAGAWAPRLSLGLDGLLQSAIAGKNAMPPKGGAADATDDELSRAIAFITNQSGSDFTPPPVPEAEAAEAQ